MRSFSSAMKAHIVGGLSVTDAMRKTWKDVKAGEVSPPPRRKKKIKIRKNPARKVKRSLSVPEKHQLAVARKTLTYTDAGARIMGGPTKAGAREIIKKLMGKTPKENSKKQKRYKRKRQLTDYSFLKKRGRKKNPKKHSQELKKLSKRLNLINYIVYGEKEGCKYYFTGFYDCLNKDKRKAARWLFKSNADRIAKLLAEKHPDIIFGVLMINREKAYYKT